MHSFHTAAENLMQRIKATLGSEEALSSPEWIYCWPLAFYCPDQFGNKKSTESWIKLSSLLSPFLPTCVGCVTLKSRIEGGFLSLSGSQLPRAALWSLC